MVLNQIDGSPLSDHISFGQKKSKKETKDSPSSEYNDVATHTHSLNRFKSTVLRSEPLAECNWLRLARLDHVGLVVVMAFEVTPVYAIGMHGPSNNTSCSFM